MIKLINPWTIKHYSEGDEVEALLYPLTEVNPSSEDNMDKYKKSIGTVIGTEKNRFGRINYLVQFSNGNSQKTLYEDIRPI